MIGQRLGQYEIVEELGRGGMATVYRAFHPQMERFVAVKIIHAALAQGDEGMERFKQEARLIARLEHPHLLPVYDYDPESEPPYIVMRYLEGGTLKEVIEAKQTIPLAEIAYLMRQITSALDYAHRNGVIHRDIKPSNIMIDADGNAYLTDFGIARIVGEVGVTQTGFAVGTPGYMSPEQGMGVANIDGRTDVYALGVMVYEMATGQAPYQGETPMAVLMQHIQAPLPFASLTNPDLPEEFDEVVQKALAKDPDARYSTPGEFAAALSALVDSADIAATPQNLRTVAVKAIKQIQEDRDTQALDKIMSEFKGTRSTGMRAVGKPGGDATKVMDFSDPKQVAAPKQTNWTLIGGIAFVVLIVIAGGFFITTQTQNANATATAEQIAADNTSEAAMAAAAQAEAETETQIAERNENATATERAKPSDTPTRGFSPTPSPTPRFAGLRALRELSIRTGPSAAYREIRTIAAGEELEIVGQSGRWYQILLPTGTTGWVLNSPLFVDSFGPLDSVPEIEAATITPTATNTPDREATRNVADRMTQNAESTETKEAANEQATENVFATATGQFNATLTSEAQATENAIATENGILTQEAIETANAQATENAIATENGILTQEAIETANAEAANKQATANAIATQEAIATANEQATANAIATQEAIAAANAQATANVISTQSAMATQTEQAILAALPGRMPYLQEFDDGASILADSSYTGGWSVGRGAGESSVLIGTARTSEGFVLLGDPEGGSPEWVESRLTDYVISFRINMTAQEGAHVVFRYTEGRPYYALDIAPGRINVRRGEGNDNPLTNRENEKFIGFARGYSTTMQLDEWYDITVWMQGQHIYVFVDNDLIADAFDDNSPRPDGGDVMFQTLNRTKDIYFDDVIIQRANPASDHFESSRFSSSWNTSVSNGEISIEDDKEDDDNRYVYMWRGTDLSANINLADFDFRTRIYSEQGGYAIYLRESDAGSIQLRLDGGNLVVSTIDESGSATQVRELENFYNRGLWEDLRIRYVGDTLEIWMNGKRELNTRLNVNLPAGQIRFETVGTGATADILRVDDFLLLEPIAR